MSDDGLSTVAVDVNKNSCTNTDMTYGIREPK